MNQTEFFRGIHFNSLLTCVGWPTIIALIDHSRYNWKCLNSSTTQDLSSASWPSGSLNGMLFPQWPFVSQVFLLSRLLSELKTPGFVKETDSNNGHNEMLPRCTLIWPLFLKDQSISTSPAKKCKIHKYIDIYIYTHREIFVGGGLIFGKLNVGFNIWRQIMCALRERERERKQNTNIRVYIYRHISVFFRGGGD